jgi:hypothetical protein
LNITRTPFVHVTTRHGLHEPEVTCTPVLRFFEGSTCNVQGDKHTHLSPNLRTGTEQRTWTVV